MIRVSPGRSPPGPDVMLRAERLRCLQRYTQEGCPADVAGADYLDHCLAALECSPAQAVAMLRRSLARWEAFTEGRDAA